MSDLDALSVRILDIVAFPDSLALTFKLTLGDDGRAKMAPEISGPETDD